MALSYQHSNWPPVFHAQPLDSDISILDQQLLSDISYPESSNSIFHDCTNGVSVTTPDDILNFPETEHFVLDQEFEPFQYSKRQKWCDYYQQQLHSDSQFQPVSFNGFVQDCTFTMTQFPDFPTAPPSYNCVGSFKKETSSSESLSAQSIAARQRRRKITEKTQELGKLVPGGQKMNTAEMLQAARKYIKFLQAQVAIFGFMESCHNHQEEKAGSEASDHELQYLAESPLIQEKLYTAEKCLVPLKFVQELAFDGETVESNPQLIQLLLKQEQ